MEAPFGGREYCFGRESVYEFDPHPTLAELASTSPRGRGKSYLLYGGKRTELALSGIWWPSPHLVLQGNYDRNDVSLPQGDFIVHLVRARFTVPIAARASIDVFIQRNGLISRAIRN